LKKDDLGDLKKCQTQCDDYLNGWKRAKADLINYQKDEAKRFEDFAKFSSKAIMKDLIVVLDSFDLALLGTKPEDKGYHMIKVQLGDLLKKHGLEEINTSPGDPFDPSIHEALMEEESTHPPGAVSEVIEKGYKLNGQVIRPARVKISK